MYRYNPYNQRRHNPYRQNLFGGLRAKAADIKDTLGRKVSSRIREGEDVAQEIEDAILEAVIAVEAEISNMQEEGTGVVASSRDDVHPAVALEVYGNAEFSRGRLASLFELSTPIDEELTARVEKADEMILSLMVQMEKNIDAAYDDEGKSIDDHPGQFDHRRYYR